MKPENFRPWGLLNWLWPRLPSKDWCMLGCASSETRCSAAWTWFHGQMVQLPHTFIWVDDAIIRDRSATENAHKNVIDDLVRLGVERSRLTRLDLLCPPQALVDTLSVLLAGQHRSVILDISAFPKRFFYFFLKLILQSANIDNLLVTYTVPQQYGVALASNPQPSMALPGFATVRPEEDVDVAIIGVGYESLGLSDLLAEQRAASIRMLIPFPSSADGYAKNQIFVSQVQKRYGANQIPEADRVDPFNSSQTFDVIAEITSQGAQSALLAPYGPKPVSLAMCLYALALKHGYGRDAPIYYAQPLTYALDYSSGVLRSGQVEQLYAYLIKWEGKDLYRLS